MILTDRQTKKRHLLGINILSKTFTSYFTYGNLVICGSDKPRIGSILQLFHNMFQTQSNIKSNGEIAQCKTSDIYMVLVVCGSERQANISHYIVI